MKKTITIEDTQVTHAVMGVLDEHAQLIESRLNVQINPSSDGITIVSEDEPHIKQAVKLLNRLVDHAKTKTEITKQLINYLLDVSERKLGKPLEDFDPKSVAVTAKGRMIKCKTWGQVQYIKAIKKQELTFGIGPAGTGKTYLAVALAVNAFKAKQVDRIILTRPAVEAGEKLGFLPGDLQMKLDPYMRPLYDALQEFMGIENYIKYMEKGVIEVSPLAYMRGRTLDRAFIILDEAQNTTSEQMKMFLTRIGFHSKVVVTGDITQIDLPREKKSGLELARKILQDVEGITFIDLKNEDIVRNELVQRIIMAYDVFEEKRV